MKKILFIIIGIISGQSSFFAQEVSKKWGLDDCINYAIEHNITAKQLQLQQENAAVELNTSKMRWLPNLNAGVGHNWNFGRSNNNLQGIYEDMTISNSNLYLSSSMPLFAGFQNSNYIKRSRLNFEAATQQLEKAKEDLALNITALFLQVLFNKEILRVSEEQLALSKQQVERTKTLVEVGKVPKSQLYDMEAQAAQDEVTLIESKNNLMIALLDLAQSLELESAQDFDIQEPNIEPIIQDAIAISSPDIIYNNAIGNKPVIKRQELLLESYKKNLKIAQSDYYPQLTLNMSYSNSYFYDYKANNNTSFSDQFSNNGGEAIGLSLSIPIFNRLQIRNQVRSARLSVEIQQLEVDNTKKSLYKEIQTAYMNATIAQEKYYATDRAVAASQESFRYAQERYNVGNMSVFEFNDARTKLIQSESSQIQAKYDYIFRTKILDFYNGVPITL